MLLNQAQAEHTSYLHSLAFRFEPVQSQHNWINISHTSVLLNQAQVEHTSYLHWLAFRFEPVQSQCEWINVRPCKLVAKPNTNWTQVKRVATCKPGKPGLISFSETRSSTFLHPISFISENEGTGQTKLALGLTRKNWLATRLQLSTLNCKSILLTILPNNKENSCTWTCSDWSINNYWKLRIWLSCTPELSKGVK